ncbi:MAG: hypothetical protein CVU56_19705 [Deltaproteobacteria bacterium HGW-Deltaproteobacteria-14]|nr:MAG: hypothetical protein CVU56_19705 [Deltaproteobacteria bacterium HGW-Deltaproteobacteria-14]
MAALSLGAGALAVSPPALAQPRPVFDPTRLHATLGDHLLVALPGEAVLTWGHLDPLPVDIEDANAEAEIPQEDFVRARLRVQPSLTLTGATWRPFALYQVAGDVDVLHHLVAVGSGRGSLGEDPAGRSDTGFAGDAYLQQLYALAAGPNLAIKVGLMRSQWGLGLLANDGSDPEPSDPATTGSPFGYAVRADRVVRAQVAVFPTAASAPGAEPPLTLAVAFDGVIDDDTARWADGDRTYQALAAVRGRYGAFSGGFYGVHRWERHHQGGETVVTVLDATARGRLVDTPDLRVWLEGEGATILGSSSLAQSATDPGAFDVKSSGGAVRFGIGAGVFEGLLEVGVASGDDNPFDDKIRAFSFDREYQVGLLMFRELLRTSTAVTALNLADPTWQGTPPRGYDHVATGGAIRGASYVNPRVTFRPTRELALYAGFLYATSDGSYVDPFRSSLVGGAPVGPNGAIEQDGLGVEVDVGARYATRVGQVELIARAELGWLDPGGVFDRAAGQEVDDVVGFWLHMGARW